MALVTFRISASRPPLIIGKCQNLYRKQILKRFIFRSPPPLENVPKNKCIWKRVDLAQGRSVKIRLPRLAWNKVTWESYLLVLVAHGVIIYLLFTIYYSTFYIHFILLSYVSCRCFKGWLVLFPDEQYLGNRLDLLLVNKTCERKI